MTARMALCALLFIPLVWISGSGCRKKSGPTCQKLASCCAGAKADPSFSSLRQVDSDCKDPVTTDESTCSSNLGDLRGAINGTSAQTRKPAPAACQ